MQERIGQGQNLAQRKISTTTDLFRQENIIVYSFSDAINKSSLDAYSRLILHVLNSHASREEQACFLNIKTLVKETALGKTTLFDRLKMLEKEGFLIRHSRTDKKGGKISSIFELTLPTYFSYRLPKMMINISHSEDEGGSSPHGLPSSPHGLPSSPHGHITSNLTYKANNSAVKIDSGDNLPLKKNKKDLAKSDKQPLPKQQQKSHSVFEEEKIPSNYLIEAKNFLGLGKEDASKDTLIEDVFSLFQDHYHNKFCRNPIKAWRTWIEREHAFKSKKITEPKKDIAISVENLDENDPRLIRKRWFSGSNENPSGQDLMENQIVDQTKSYSKIYNFCPSKNLNQYHILTGRYLSEPQKDLSGFEKMLEAEFGLRSGENHG